MVSAVIMASAAGADSVLILIVATGLDQTHHVHLVQSVQINELKPYNI